MNKNRGFWREVKLNTPKGRYVIDARWFLQYAEGVTGVSHKRTIYAIPEGFKTKTEARQFMKVLGLKPYHRRGRKDEGYGSVGEESLTIDIVPAELIREEFHDYINDTFVYTREECEQA